MDYNYGLTLRQQIEKLMWGQVELYENINLRIGSGDPLLLEGERQYLDELKRDIGQLVVMIDAFEEGYNKAIFRPAARQLLLPTIEQIPIDPDEIPF